MEDPDPIQPESEHPPLLPFEEHEEASEHARSTVVQTLRDNDGNESGSLSLELIDNANDEVARLLSNNCITQSQVSNLQKILRENISLKEKVSKLKALLQKSSRATRDVKAELDAHKKELDLAYADIKQLKLRALTLSNRPTHYDLIADFDKNFERALCTVQNKSSIQSQGEDPSSFSLDQMSPHTSHYDQESTSEEQPSTLLIQEWKDQCSHMEMIHASLMDRISILEREKRDADTILYQLQSEIHACRLEKDHAIQAMTEMQLEIDLVTKSAMDANFRAAKGRQVVEHFKCDKMRSHELRNQIEVLTEWATAEASAKQLLMERNVELEKRIQTLIDNKEGGQLSWKNNYIERILWKTSSSAVIGAGMIHTELVEFGRHKLGENETVVLRWQFDILPQDMDICFSLVRGRCHDAHSFNETDFIIRDRLVTGGAGGENEGIFTVNNTCTLIFSNEKAWVRPRVIHFSLEIFAVR